MSTVEIILSILIVCEMLFCNLLNVDLFAKRKYSRFVTYGVEIIISVVLIGGLFILLVKNENFGNGNGLFMLFGTVFIIPIKILYEKPFRKSLVVLYSSWILTAISFVFGVQLAYLISPEHLVLITLITQTILIVVVLFFVYKLMLRKYKNLFDLMTTKVMNNYLFVALLMYISIVFINYSFINQNRFTFFISIICLLAACLFLFYFIFELVFTKKNNIELSKQTMLDSLTGLKNRNALLEQYQKYQDNNTSFNLVFIDLDHFKTINDTYGHDNGDKYLISFCQYVSNYFISKGELYRLYGDEFVILSTSNIMELEEMLKACHQSLMNKKDDIRFIGYSYGVVSINSFDTPFEHELKRADKELYKNKKINHIKI